MAFDLIRRVETLGHPRILVVGDLILDRYVWGDAERISQEAPVPLLRADHREHRLGGAASVATMLRALGAEVRLIGVVGRDAEAVLVRRLLAELAIDDGLVLRPRRPADHAQGAVHRPGAGPAPAADDPRRLRDARPDPRRTSRPRFWSGSPRPSPRPTSC